MTRRSRFDRILDAIGHRYRRRLLYALRARNPRDASEIEVIVDGTDSAVDDRDRAVRCEALMYHHHLPKLDDAGYIEWDRDTGTITTGREWSDIAPLLEVVREREDELAVDRH